MTVISVALFDVGSQPLARRGDGPAFEGFKPTDLLQQFGNLRRILSGQSSDLCSHGSHNTEPRALAIGFVTRRDTSIEKHSHAGHFMSFPWQDSIPKLSPAKRWQSEKILL